MFSKIQCHNARRLRFESLEARRVLAQVTVSNFSDDVNGDTTDIPDLIANQGGDGISLREAIEAANGTGGFDTILFNSTLSGETITLTQGHLYLYDSVIIDATNQDITIDANDPTPADGNGDGSRIFNIIGFPGDEYEINGLTLTGGDERLEGGAIRSEDANLTLRNTTITGNKGSNGGGNWVHKPKIGSFPPMTLAA